MSQEHYRQEAHRWLKQSQADLQAAGNSLTAGNYEWACFQAEQAGQKALKAVWYFHAHDPWGHSLFKLIQDFPDAKVKQELMGLAEDAKALDKLYIPTRYPNGLPGVTPAEVYTEKDARHAIQAAQRIIEATERKLAES